VVFKLHATGTETVLYGFAGYPSDGANPYAPLTRDKDGNIYGTTSGGGSAGYGTVFKIDTAGNETVLYSFTGGADGCNPNQGLIRDDAGNLYGTTWACGPKFNSGTIFKLDAAENFNLLHSFSGWPSDGASPEYGRLKGDESGNLYGVTPHGGASGDGVLYKLSTTGKLTLLHSFAGPLSDGCLPFGSVVRDKAGNFYGTTDWCGSSNNYGTIWKVTREGEETILHNFAGGPSDGCNPHAGLTQDSNGNLYGITLGCGAYNYGALYELTSSGKFILLHSFDSSDGASPWGEVLWTSNGTLFGTTTGGGTGAYGTVWSYVP